MAAKSIASGRAGEKLVEGGRHHLRDASPQRDRAVMAELAEALNGWTRNRLSLHQRILADITERIVSGDWPPGHRIPFEHELSAEYQCSRMTVNKAMSQLAKSGLIERRRRSGSFVRRPRSQAAILEIHDIKAEVQALGRPIATSCWRDDVRRVTASERSRLLDVTPSASVVALACRHFAGKQPFCLEQRLISLAAVPEAADEEFFADLRPARGCSAACRGVPPSTSSAPSPPSRNGGCTRHSEGRPLPGRRTPDLERRRSR